MLVWPARSRGELGSRFVPIRARPTNVLVHFVICRYGKHCYLADSCPYPHSKEELEAWTLDRDGSIERLSVILILFLNTKCVV